jgi:hypothetical protein
VHQRRLGYFATVIVTVATVKDTLANVQRHVRGNLAGGADLVVLFLDAPDPEVEGWLAEQPHTAYVATDESWWRGERPAELNVRQRTNANLLKALLTLVDGAEWVFHIDGDEVVWIDRGALATVPAEREAVRLAPLEAVAQREWAGDPTWFKRALDDEELADLAARGVVAEPTNSAYFHGHPFGKAGLRPRLDRWLRLHDVVDADGERVRMAARPRLRMLHYESYSGADFVRKWSSILASGPGVGFRADRQPTADAIRAVLAAGLPQADAEARLMEVFAATTEDDLPLLRDLGLLVEADPRGWTHRPEPLPGRERLDELLQRVREEPKQPFHPGTPAAAVAAVLARIERPVRAGRSWLRRS